MCEKKKRACACMCVYMCVLALTTATKISVHSFMHVISEKEEEGEEENEIFKSRFYTGITPTDCCCSFFRTACRINDHLDFGL